MPQQQMSELTTALDKFNNVTLPALAFFFAVLFLLIMGLLIRGLFGRDERRDELTKMALKTSSENGVAITGVKQDIVDALNGIREDRAASDAKHDRTLRVLSRRVKDYNGNIIKLNTTTGEIAQAINKVNDGINDIKTALPTLARKSEMDLAIGRMDDAIKALEEARKACLEKKKDTKEIPLIPSVHIEGTITKLDNTPDELKPTGTG